MKKLVITFFILLFLPLLSFAENINVAFTIDNNYPLYTMLVIESILEHNASNSDYTFYIVESNVTAKNKARMTKFVKKYNQNIEFVHCDSNALVKGKDLYKFSNRITSIAMARILLSNLLPKVDKVLYLDSDVLVTDDLNNLYSTNIDKYLCAMVINIVQENPYSDLVDNFPKGIYYNSGVILMNLKKWRKEKVTEQMVDFLHENIELFRYENDASHVFLYPDQDLINIFVQNKVLSLSKKWNNQTAYGSRLFDFNDSGIIHYIGPIKPWSFKSLKYPYRMYYKFWLAGPLKMQIIPSFFYNMWKSYINICKNREKFYF